MSSYKMKMELENQRFAEEQASQELHFQAEREVLDKQVTTERNDRLALKKDLEERLERQEKQHMAAAEELISLYEKKLSLSVAKYEELQQQYADLKTAAEAKHAELLATNTATQNHILSQFKHKVATQRKAHADLKSYLEYVKTQYNEMLAQQDREHDQEVLSLKSYVWPVQHVDDVCIHLTCMLLWFWLCLCLWLVGWLVGGAQHVSIPRRGTPPHTHETEGRAGAAAASRVDAEGVPGDGQHRDGGGGEAATRRDTAAPTDGGCHESHAGGGEGDSGSASGA